MSRSMMGCRNCSRVTSCGARLAVPASRASKPMSSSRVSWRVMASRLPRDSAVQAAGWRIGSVRMVLMSVRHADGLGHGLAALLRNIEAHQLTLAEGDAAVLALGVAEHRGLDVAAVAAHAFVGQQPVDEQLGGIGMRRLGGDADGTRGNHA